MHVVCMFHKLVKSFYPNTCGTLVVVQRPGRTGGGSEEREGCTQKCNKRTSRTTCRAFLSRFTAALEHIKVENIMYNNIIIWTAT